MAEGGCLCGKLRYSVDGPFELMLNCHCSMCRKHHGAPFATFVGAALTGFRWVAGGEEVLEYTSSPKGKRCFCPTCGSVAPLLVPQMNLALCPAGNLEGDLGVKPQAHIFVGSKAPWYAIADSLPQHEEYPPEFATPGVERPAISLKDGVIQGSCLCGEVAYEIHGTPTRLWYCHCSRCRKARSAAHNANLFARADQLRWTQGEQNVVDYRLPEARFFAIAFCRRCGSGVPRVSVERNIAIVPVGSLDADPGIRASAHIFAGSKAPWFDITGDVPQYEDVPPQF